MLTTVESTGHPVSELDFPAITICGQGTIDDTVDLATEQQIREYFKVNMHEIRTAL